MGSQQSPLGGLLNGVVQGYGLRQQILNWQQQNQAAKAKQALDEHRAQMEDIQNQLALQNAGRPVTAGMVQDTAPASIDRIQENPAPAPPGVPNASDSDAADQVRSSMVGGTAQPASDAASGYGVPKLPDMNGPSASDSSSLDALRATSAAPAANSNADVTNLPQLRTSLNPGGSYLRKADASRTTTYKSLDGRKIQVEMYTPEEQQQRAQATQSSGFEALETAKAKAQAKAQGIARQYQLAAEGGGSAAPAGLDNIGIPKGTLLTRTELQAGLEAEQKLREGSLKTLSPGQTMYDTSSEPGGSRPADSQQGAVASPPLAGSPVVARMRAIASGGPANPTGEYAEFKGSFEPGYYQEKGIANPTPEDTKAAYSAFLSEKKQKSQPEWAASEVELAQRAANGDKAAEAALKRLDQSKIAARPVNNFIATVPGLGPGTPSAAQPGLTGEDFLKTLPAGTAAQVRSIANGTTTMPPFGTRGASALLRDAVYRFDPSYTEQRPQVHKAFTTGPDGKNIGSLNTAVVHLDQLSEAAKALQNGSFVPANRAFQATKAMFGSNAPTNFESLKSAVSGEMANALKGQATDPEISNIAKTLQAANSPAQLSGAVETNLHILGAKLNTYKDRYNQQIPSDSVYSPVLPSAKAAFARHGMTETGATGPAESAGKGAGNRIQVTDPRGVVHNFPTQQQADAFKKAAGIGQ